MEKKDSLQIWLDNVAAHKSRSQNTHDEYKRNFQAFLDYVDLKSADQIVREYQNLKSFFAEKKFKEKYTGFLTGWISHLSGKGLTDGSVRVMVAATQSFFSYMNLPLNKVLLPNGRVVYHNRDIERKEIVEVLRVSSVRDKAFFAFLAQSGLRPHSICQLRIKDLQPDLDKGAVPLLVTVRQDITKGKYKGHITFIAEDAIEYLKAYLKTRENLTPESYLFTSRFGDREEPVTPESLTHSFGTAVRKLKVKGVLKFEERIGKPAEIHLYNLRKFFRNNCAVGSEAAEYFMGHTQGVKDHYLAENPETYRKLYAEKAMPNLRLEEKTPIETEKTILDQAVKLQKLEEDLKTQQELLERMAALWHRGQKEDVAGEVDKLLDDVTKSHYPDHETEEERLKRMELSKKKQKST